MWLACVAPVTFLVDSTSELHLVGVVLQVVNLAQNSFSTTGSRRDGPCFRRPWIPGVSKGPVRAAYGENWPTDLVENWGPSWHIESICGWK